MLILYCILTIYIHTELTKYYSFQTMLFWTFHQVPKVHQHFVLLILECVNKIDRKQIKIQKSIQDC